MDTYIEVIFKGQTINGILINEDKNYYTIKLSSGYNAMLYKQSVSIIKKEKKEHSFEKPKSENKKNKNLPTIALLHTGGTIASKIDYQTGAVSSKFTPEELLGLYPELLSTANIVPKMIANLSSEDMRFEHYNLLLDAIKKSVDEGVDGVIISHGTDTMHYTSAALSYGLQGLSVPVLLVGAQRSSDRASSDAYSNLTTAVNFIANQKDKEYQYRRVGICMHNSISDDEFVILDGINAKKMHSSRRDAFKQINYKPAAVIDKDNTFIEKREELFSLSSNDSLELNYYDTSLKIGFFKAHPNLGPEEIEILKIYDGLVIEGTGLGHLAVSEFDDYTKINLENLEAIKNLQKTTKVVVGVQTNSGQTNMNIYSSGRYLIETGVLGQGWNLTTETLFIRMAYCLSCKENFDDVWNSNLEGFEMKSYDSTFS